MDLTYIPMARGFVYLTAVMDWATRKILMWRLMNTLAPDGCVAALEDALLRYGCPGILNTDQGAPFTSAAFLALLDDRPIRLSMDGRGAWKDNVFVERFWKSLKYEEVYLHSYASVSEAGAGIARYISFYNTRRPHHALRRRTPDQVYTAGRLHEAAAEPRGTPLIPAA